MLLTSASRSTSCIQLCRPVLFAAALLAPALAQAQFSDISQSGYAITSIATTVFYPTRQITTYDAKSQTLADLANGTQTISTQGWSDNGAAKLTTSVSSREINVALRLDAHTSFDTIYGDNHVAFEVTKKAADVKATVDVHFKLDQGTAISVLGTNPFDDELAFRTPQLGLGTLDAQGKTVSILTDSDVYKVTWLEAGNYSLSVSGYVATQGSSYSQPTSGYLSSSIGLRASAVPEPSSWVLWSLGGLLMCVARRHRRNRIA
jgi:hypothetical protein